MNNYHLTNIKSDSNYSIPYDLLLMADETVDAVNRYIHNCDIFTIQKSLMNLGVCAVQQVNSSTIEIKNIGVLPEHRNLGIGSWCIKSIQHLYPNQKILVGTGDASIGALQFYQRNGFIKYDVRREFYLNNYNHPIIENGRQLIDQIVLIKSDSQR